MSLKIGHWGKRIIPPHPVAFLFCYNLRSLAARYVSTSFLPPRNQNQGQKPTNFVRCDWVRLALTGCDQASTGIGDNGRVRFDSSTRLDKAGQGWTRLDKAEQIRKPREPERARESPREPERARESPREPEINRKC